MRSFLAKRSDSLRDKRLVALSFSAPYYLDTTEISKLTAYFGVYGHTAPFLEAAVRALFREFTPTGAPPRPLPGTDENRAARRTLAYLERWLQAILADRRARLYSTPA